MKAIPAQDVKYQTKDKKLKNYDYGEKLQWGLRHRLAVWQKEKMSVVFDAWRHSRLEALHRYHNNDEGDDKLH